MPLHPLCFSLEHPTCASLSLAQATEVFCAEQWELIPSLVCPKAKRGSQGNVLRPHRELFPVQGTAAAVTQCRNHCSFPRTTERPDTGCVFRGPCAPPSAQHPAGLLERPEGAPWGEQKA